MNEWIGTKQETYLEAIAKRDSPHGVYECSSCSRTPAHWRCKDCLGNRALCRDCCRVGHRDLPFHRIEFWTGTHYERDWLSNLGVVIHLGHHGQCCPVRNTVKLLTEIELCSENWDIYHSPSGLVDQPVECNSLTVVHTNGIHKVWVRTCSCREGGEEYQFLELGLYPASYKRIETLFTCDLLQNCRLDNLECKASVYHLWAKLKRLTCPFFPNGVPASNIPFFLKMFRSDIRVCISPRIGIRNCFVCSGNGET